MFLFNPGTHKEYIFWKWQELIDADTTVFDFVYFVK